MRVNIYAEEMTDRLEIITKTTPDGEFTGLRLYLELPVTLPDGQLAAGPFMHHPGDDDSAAVTFWGKRDLRKVLRKALKMLDEHHVESGQDFDQPVTISINGIEQFTLISVWTYEMIANSAGLDPCGVYSATYARADQSKSTGILSPGEKILVGHGTRISIVDTSNA